MKKSFLIHLDSLEILEELSDEQAGKLLKAFQSYHLGIQPELDQMLRIAFKPFQLQFERDADKYKETSERNSLNGTKGGRPKKQENQVGFLGLSDNQPKAKKADNDSDSDNDSDNVNEKKKKQVFDFSLYGSFSNLIERWAKYRKAENKPIKSQDSLDTFSKRLNKLSDGDFQKAEAIIEQAIANGWQGIFELKGTLNVNSNNSQLPVDASQIVNYGKGNGKVFFDKKAGLWYEPLTNGYLPKEISDYYYYDQGNHSNYGDYVRWMIENDKTPMPPEDTRYFPQDWNFEKFVSEQRAIVAASNL
jgi:hypothetical protein